MARLDQDAAGRLLEDAGDCAPREMTVRMATSDRTRLTGRSRVHPFSPSRSLCVGGCRSPSHAERDPLLGPTIVRVGTACCSAAVLVLAIGACGSGPPPRPAP